MVKNYYLKNIMKLDMLIVILIFGTISINNSQELGFALLAITFSSQVITEYIHLGNMFRRTRKTMSKEICSGTIILGIFIGIASILLNSKFQLQFSFFTFDIIGAINSILIYVAISFLGSRLGLIIYEGINKKKRIIGVFLGMFIIIMIAMFFFFSTGVITAKLGNKLSFEYIIIRSCMIIIPIVCSFLFKRSIDKKIDKLEFK